MDELLVTESWNKQKAVAAREGIVAIAYERKYGEYSRIYQMAKLILWATGSGLYSCPIAMTGRFPRCFICLTSKVFVSQSIGFSMGKLLTRVCIAQLL